ncbi:MAG: hypothetical protein GXC72_00920 [Chitinophagaceae bacterium]|jgi:hypothetical protein|nr:hypothetical protein [Chitinophagaceae bacterium]
MKDSTQKAVAELFDFANPDECKQLLWEWFRSTIVGNYHSLDQSEKDAIAGLYERLNNVFQSG